MWWTGVIQVRYRADPNRLIFCVYSGDEEDDIDDLDGPTGKRQHNHTQHQLLLSKVSTSITLETLQ